MSTEQRFIEIHTFKIYSRKDSDNTVPLNDIGGTDLLKHMFSNFVPFTKINTVNKFQKKTIKICKEDGKHQFYINSSKRLLYGKLSSGNFGKIEDVEDIDSTDGEPVFVIQPNHSVQKPFFFMLCIPEIKDTGYILLEREGNIGVKQVFESVFERYIKFNFSEYKVVVQNFIDPDVVEKYVNKGEYSTISLTKNFLPSDVADSLGLGKYETSDYTIELTIKARNGKVIPSNAKGRIQSMFKGQRGGYFVNSDLSKYFDNDSNIVVKSTLNSNSRTINLSDNMRFRPYYVVNVELDNKFHSLFPSIKSESIKLLESFGLDIYKYEIEKQYRHEVEN